MSTNDNLPTPIQANAVDYVTAGAKAILSAIPFAGSLLAEIAGSIIPRQRVDRIADFASKLEQRIEHLEKGSVTAALNDEEFTDLSEEALRQASRATTSERREYLATLLATSLSSDAISYAETKHLMRLLGELSDVEVIWLRFYAVPTTGRDQEFRELHKNVLHPKSAHLGSSEDEVDAEAIQKSYRDHLIRLGLVSAEIAKDRDGAPEFDRFSGNFKVKCHQASRLGLLLLKQIGLAPQGRR
ncbi:hypothetical protein VX159_05815 [Dechloromonas sp. ZY10]|uniref:hypothetical protein n=1 Tax=Dechloromonas aquae TaxID=2664436 RepID=UPI0035299AD6